MQRVIVDFGLQVHSCILSPPRVCVVGPEALPPAALEDLARQHTKLCSSFKESAQPTRCNGFFFFFFGKDSLLMVLQELLQDLKDVPRLESFVRRA